MGKFGSHIQESGDNLSAGVAVDVVVTNYADSLMFLQTPPLKRSRQDCDILSSLLRGEDFEQIRTSQRGLCTRP